MRGSVEVQSRGRWSRLIVAALVVTLVVLTAPLAARAAPGGSDDGDPKLQAALAVASRGYNDAKGRLAAARQRQVALAAQAQATAVRLAEVTTEVTAMAVVAYKGGRIGALTVLLDSGSAGQLLERATMLDSQARRDNAVLRDLHRFQTQYDQQRAALAAEVANGQNQLALMAKRKKDAENALAAAAGGAPVGGPTGGAATATPAPRNPDGSWPPESCSINDPTTSGCITPRMLHAYQEARKAGFTHYTSCHRNGGSGEHPKGRACDFSAHSTGFVDARATGADKAYGDRLAAWLIANSDRLAVLYVIWYKRIWLPSSGWRSYSGDGTPAGDHYNHVHLSVQ